MIRRIVFMAFAISLAVFVYVVLPLVSVTLAKSKAVKVANRGKQIVLCILDDGSYRTGPDLPRPWPVDGAYASSTAFLRAIALDVMAGLDNFSYFGASGIPAPAVPTSADSFTSANNAWCAVSLPPDADADAFFTTGSLPDNVPFLFTKNIGFGHPPRPAWPGATIADMTGLIPNQAPFGDKCAVVVTYSGRALIVSKADAIQTKFNPKGYTFKVLSP